MRLSANLGFLWTELPLPEAIRAAARAGFDAVECHFPYDVAPALVRAALDETRLPMLSLNTAPGPGGRGLAALPGHERAARAAIDQAVAYAAEVGAGLVHVMAGCATGPQAMDTYVANLRYAADKADAAAIGLLIEPLNSHDVPGYAIHDMAGAAEVQSLVGRPRLRLMLDLYHILRMGGDPLSDFALYRDRIGHIQFATPPARTRPDARIGALLRAISAQGWSAPFGAEYRPGGQTEASLAWLQDSRA